MLKLWSDCADRREIGSLCWGHNHLCNVPLRGDSSEIKLNKSEKAWDQSFNDTQACWSALV